MSIRFTYRSDVFGSPGEWALLMFVMCLISGVALVGFYDSNQAEQSLRLMMIQNPYARIIRNLHYWTGQLSLLFALIHILEYLLIRSISSRLPGRLWIALCLSVLPLYYVMISGFILKGDTDAQQAHRIFFNLLESLPLIGSWLAQTFAGNGDELQFLYIHHVATASIILIIIIYEHHKPFWPRAEISLMAVILACIMSLFFNAPMHDGYDPVVKGPWYFVGFQEILHYVGHPAWAWLIILGLLAMMAGMKWVGKKGLIAFRGLLWIFTLAYFMASIAGYFFRGENWQWQLPWQVEAKQYTPFHADYSLWNGHTYNHSDQRVTESCLACHGEMKGFSPSHPPEVIGCVACHGGNPLTMDAKLSHAHMEAIPGNLADASRSCGTRGCHPGIPQRVNSHLMTTNSGIVSVDRFVFGEETHPDVLSHIQDLGQTAADNHLRDLCAGCHLGLSKQEFGPVNELSRGGGCLACHLNYSGQSLAQLKNYVADKSKLPQLHPSIDLNITNDHCLGCHSRSGRISTSYEGWHETIHRKGDILIDSNHRLFADGRIYEKQSADVHHELGLSCIDCHNSYELMGDGHRYTHEEDAVKVACSDCHFNYETRTTAWDALDHETKTIASLKGRQHKEREYLALEANGQGMYNLYLDDMGRPHLAGKLNQKDYLLSPPAEACRKDAAHKDLDCNTCHTAWVPKCIGCHNEYDREEQGYDLLDRKFVSGAWVEYGGLQEARPPALGVSYHDSIRKIVTAVPGMILSINVSSYDPEGPSKLFHRLYAPFAAHTTVKKGRSCADCHLDPEMLGFGAGHLTYKLEGTTGAWSFTPRFASNPNDGLPEDAWTGFLEDRNDITATRTYLRPFNMNEQQQLLLVASCLSCHDGQGRIMQASLEDFNRAIDNRSPACILPE